MSEFLRQIGWHPLYYWLAAGGTGLLWLASAALPHEPAGRGLPRFNPPALFGLLLLAAMFAWRWPAVFFYKPVNPDEPQFLAGAITLLARGDVWWPDTMTSGPLVVLPLALPGLAGRPVDFSHGRIVALLLSWGAVMLTYLSLRHVHGDRKARLLVLPPACLFVFLLFWDFVPYCSELAPIFLCSLATWLTLTAFAADGRVTNRGRLTAAGLVLGMMPFSKLQVLPLVAAIGLSAIIWIFRQPASDKKNLPRDLLGLAGGAGAGFALLLLSLWHGGGLENVYASYWAHNLYYAGARAMPWTSSFYVLHYLTGISWGFASFHCGLLALLLLSFWARPKNAWRPLLLGGLLTLAAYFAVLVPGRLYPHYLLFLALPLSLLVGLRFGDILFSPELAPRRSLVFGVLFLVLGAGLQLLDRVADWHFLARLPAAGNAWAGTVGFINRVKRPGDTLAVWGWRPEIYVETQLPQATHEALTEAQLHENPQRDFFRARFLADLQASRPAFFVDAIGPDGFIYQDVARDGHESFPALRDLVAREYQLLSRGGSFRVYVRRDLVK